MAKRKLQQSSEVQEVCSRNPSISIYGRMGDAASFIWLLHPTTVTDNTTEKIYSLNWLHTDRLRALNAKQLASKEMVEFAASAKKLLEKPLGSLSCDEYESPWKFNGSTCSLSAHQQQIVEGFTYNMANQRGRTAVSRILTAFFETDKKVVYNCGGSNYHNEPAVRSVNFTSTNAILVSDSSASSDQSSPEDQMKKKMCSIPVVQEKSEKEILSQHIFFVPDIVIEEKNDSTDEILLVEVKKGHVLTYKNESQLKYMLLPSAIKKGTALGLLICAKEATIMKYTVTSDDLVKLETSQHRFGTDSLVNDVINVLCLLKHHI